MTIDTTLLNDVFNKAKQLLDRLELQQAPAKSQIHDMDYSALRWDKNRGFTPISWVSPLSQDKLLHGITCSNRKYYRVPDFKVRLTNKRPLQPFKRARGIQTVIRIQVTYPGKCKHRGNK